MKLITFLQDQKSIYAELVKRKYSVAFLTVRVDTTVNNGKVKKDYAGAYRILLNINKHFVKLKKPCSSVTGFLVGSWYMVKPVLVPVTTGEMKWFKRFVRDLKGLTNESGYSIHISLKNEMELRQSCLRHSEVTNNFLNPFTLEEAENFFLDERSLKAIACDVHRLINAVTKNQN